MGDFTMIMSAITLVVTMTAQVTVDPFGEIKLFTLKNRAGMVVRLTNYGAIITSIVVPDRTGKFADVALGYNRLEGYMNAVDRPYFGAIVGRFGNRIAAGTFSLDGKTYTLARNNPPNHLHGGIIGFDKVVWDAKPSIADKPAGVTLSYLAKDGEEGYPGNLQVSVTYSLTDDNEIMVKYLAKTDKATPINLTQHTYFNLQGEGEGTMLDHELMINANAFTPVDATSIPTGEIRRVAGTPFDFRTSKRIGKDIDADDEQIRFGNGFDHNWVLNPPPQGQSMTLAARVVEPTSGRILEVRTTEPGVQFYAGNFLDGRLHGKAGKPYVRRGGFCLETQHFPDSPNKPQFPSTILKPGQVWESTTAFRFFAQ
jgi:aldose 1-epimerase